MEPAVSGALGAAPPTNLSGQNRGEYLVLVCARRRRAPRGKTSQQARCIPLRDDPSVGRHDVEGAVDCLDGEARSPRLGLETRHALTGGHRPDCGPVTPPDHARLTVT